jgi:hypothetical protein
MGSTRARSQTCWAAWPHWTFSWGDTPLSAWAQPLPCTGLKQKTPPLVLDPGVRMRPAVGLIVHQRSGAPLQGIAGRLSTAPAWTAVEVARQLHRPRVLATLDAALRSMQCTGSELESAVARQRGRQGIVAVRELLPFADGRAESAMESEARLVMIDRGLPLPELQYPIRDGEAVARRLRMARGTSGGGIRKHRLACRAQRDASRQNAVGHDSGAWVDDYSYRRA